MTTYFMRKSEMAQHATATGLELIRCKLQCSHVPVRRAAILVVNGNIITERLIRCKVCAMKGGHNG